MGVLAQHCHPTFFFRPLNHEAQCLISDQPKTQIPSPFFFFFFPLPSLSHPAFFFVRAGGLILLHTNGSSARSVRYGVLDTLPPKQAAIAWLNHFVVICRIHTYLLVF